MTMMHMVIIAAHTLEWVDLQKCFNMHIVGNKEFTVKHSERRNSELVFCVMHNYPMSRNFG